MDTDALGDLAVGDAMRMRFPGHGVFTGKVVGFEGNKVDVHWNEDSSSTLLTPAQALKARVAHAQAEPKRSPKKKKADFEFGADEEESGSEEDDEEEEEEAEEEEAPAPKRRRAREAAAPVRRSTREQKSVGVYVDGFFVKKSNLYDAETGERSVWDQELAGDRDAAAAFGASTKPPPKRKSSTTIKTKDAPKKPRHQAKAEQARDAQRDAAKSRLPAARACRARFLLAHKDALAPFKPSLNWCKEAAKKAPQRVVIEPFERTPSYIKADMRDYQREGLRWLAQRYEDGCGAILGDEMGLGKTLQTLSFLSWLKHERPAEHGPSLVICPLSVLSSWLTEARKFVPDLRMVKLHSGDVRERDRLKHQLRDTSAYDVVVTTYEMAKAPAMQSTIQRPWWRLVVLDEGHVIKNEEADISKAVRRLHAERALLLTGTPLQNDLHELWALLNFLFPDVFPDSTAFDDAFDRGKGGKQGALAKAHNMMNVLMKRRVKSEVETTLPPRLETKILVPLAESQRWWYKRLLLRQSELLDQLNDPTGGPQTGAWKKLQSLLMQLRKCCNHPYLFEGADPDPGVTDESLIEASGKVHVLDRLLTKLKDRGHRVVLFSQFTTTLDLLDDVLRYRGYEFSRLDGGTNRVQRTVDIQSFNAPNSSVFLFLMSTRAGGLGVNLQTADTCILFDSDWNPQADLQAMARVHRIGQTKPVHVYRLVTAGTVEERIVQRAEKKLYLDAMVNRDSQRAAEPDDQVSAGDMLSALKFGAAAIVNGAADKQLTDQDLDQILDRSRDGNATLGVVKGNQASDAASFKSDTQAVSLREFEGATYGAKREKRATLGDLSAEFIQQEKRKRTQRMRQERVEGVGLVNVLTKEYGDGQERKKDAKQVDEQAARWEAKAAKAALEAVGGRQIAGRDYDNEEHCLNCWDGGDLICCDQCPASWHAGCLQKIGFALPTKKFGSWGCPHHSCETCGRKAAQAGGLLFRCAVCPSAFCEDHLPSTATIQGKCERFMALGQNHPKQAAFIICGAGCKQFCKDRGLSSTGHDVAAAISGAAGLDTTTLRQEAPPREKLRTDERDDRTRLAETNPDASTRLDAALAKKRFSVAQSSPHFIMRCGTSKTGVASAVDALHSILYADDEAKGGLSRSTEALAKEIGEWTGVGEGPDLKDRAAELYLTLNRLFETWRTYELDALTWALQFVQLERGRKPRAREARIGNKRVRHELLAQYLVAPRQGALWLVQTEDESGGVRASGVTTFDLADEKLVKRHYVGVRNLDLAGRGNVEIAMEQRYADGAGRRLSLTMDKWGGDRPFDLTVPRVSDNPPPPPPPPPPAAVPFFNLGAAPADAASAPYRSKGKAPTHPFGHWPTAPAPMPGGGRAPVGENDPCGTCGRTPAHTTFSRFVTTGARRKTCDACKAKKDAQKAKKAAAPRPAAVAPPRAQPEQPVEVRSLLPSAPWRRFASAAAAATHFPGVTARDIEALVAGTPMYHLTIEARRATASPTSVVDLTSSPSESPSSRVVTDLSSPSPRPGGRKSPGKRAASPGAGTLKDPGLREKMRAPRSA